MTLLAFKTAPVPGPVFEKRDSDFLAFCPSCKSFETVWFERGTLMSTRKFTQRGGLVFHNCGSLRPCRLYRNS
jgi:hypothetical protein